MAEKIFVREGYVSERYSVPIRTLRNDRYLKKGIPYIKKNRSVFYRLSDVEEYLERNRIVTSD
jgi:hypothetical protein